MSKLAEMTLYSMQQDQHKEIELAQGGDLDAFGKLILVYQDRVRAFLAARLRDHHLIEDLCQETFIVAFKRIDSYRIEASFAAWLRSIAHNLLRNEWRRKREQQMDLQDQIVAEAQDAATVDLEDHIGHLRACMDALPERSRVLIAARYADGKSIAALCNDFSVKHSAMTMNLHRIRHQIKQCMESRGVQP